MIDDPYQVLGLERGASDEEVQKSLAAAWQKSTTPMPTPATQKLPGRCRKSTPPMSKLRIPLRPVHPAMAAALTPAALATARTPLRYLWPVAAAAAPAGTPVPHHRGPGCLPLHSIWPLPGGPQRPGRDQTRDGQWSLPQRPGQRRRRQPGHRSGAHPPRRLHGTRQHPVSAGPHHPWSRGGAPIAARPAPTAASAAWGTCACPCACAGAPSGASAPGAEGKICFELPSKDFWQEIGDSSDFLPDFSL